MTEAHAKQVQVWSPIITAVVAVASVVFVAGHKSSAIDANTERSKINASAIQVDRVANSDRLARIETKVDALLEAQRNAP